MILVNKVSIKHFCNNSKLNGFPQKRLKKKEKKAAAKWPDHGGMVVPKEEVIVLPKMTGEGESGGESRATLLLGDEVCIK